MFGVTVAVRVTTVPTGTGFFEELTTTLVAVCVIVSVIAGEVLVRKFTSPVYVAVMVCAPTASVLLANVACPAETEPVPRTAVPSLNCTDPVAAEGVTVAVKVTFVPNAAESAEEATVTLVFAWVTFWVTVLDVPPALAGSPL